jgi:hypothetical protein
MNVRKGRDVDGREGVNGVLCFLLLLLLLLLLLPVRLGLRPLLPRLFHTPQSVHLFLQPSLLSFEHAKGVGDFP